MLAICKLFSFYIHPLILRLELLNSFYAGYFFMFVFLSSAEFFFKINLKKKKMLSGIPSDSLIK